MWVCVPCWITICVCVCSHVFEHSFGNVEIDAVELERFNFCCFFLILSLPIQLQYIVYSREKTFWHVLQSVTTSWWKLFISLIAATASAQQSKLHNENSDSNKRQSKEQVSSRMSLRQSIKSRLKRHLNFNQSNISGKKKNRCVRLLRNAHQRNTWHKSSIFVEVMALLYFSGFFCFHFSCTWILLFLFVFFFFKL